MTVEKIINDLKEIETELWHQGLDQTRNICSAYDVGQADTLLWVSDFLGKYISRIENLLSKES